MTLSAALGCADGRPGAVSNAEVEAALAEARGASDALGRELASKLFAERAEGGPTPAVRVCSEVAPAIAAAASREGRTVRRVSLRARNPGDEPDSWERPRLEALARSQSEGRLPDELHEVVESADGVRLRYLKPILVAEPCLACHGDPARLDPEVVAILAERYPEDRATGYAVGDLRGAFSVSVALR